jgi:hypothetical protein
LSSTNSKSRWLPKRRRAASPFFTIARFEPDTLGVFGLLAAATAALLVTGSVYLPLLTSGVLLVIFAIESSETIQLDRVKERRIVGARCLVLKGASSTERGLARLFRADGRLDPELWSFEAASPIEEGETALVRSMRSVILEVAPAPREEANTGLGAAGERREGVLAVF